MGENFLLSCWRDSGLVGKSIIVFLALISLYSWAVMLVKWQWLRQSRKASENFLKRFRGNRKDVFHLYPKLNRLDSCPATEVYKAACQQLYPYVADDRGDPYSFESEGGKRLNDNILTALEDSISSIISSQSIILEKQMIFLATAASVSPFLGLFGTVWGVMIAFRGMGIEGTASLATVAPGISEALITTAAGLAVAIPALIGHNYFQGQIKTIITLTEDFSAEFLAQVRRQFLG